MSLESIFTFVNIVVLPFWLLLMIAPRSRLTAQLAHGPFIPLLLGVVYSIGLAAVMFFHQGKAGGGFGSLAELSLAFSAPVTALIGWIHYLIFDLFIGAWQTRDALRLRLPHAVRIPCLFFTLMAGPFGLLLYLMARLILRRRATLQED